MARQDARTESGRAPKRPKVRWDRIAALREEIRRGTYDDPAKWEKVLDKLSKDLRDKS